MANLRESENLYSLEKTSKDIELQTKLVRKIIENERKRSHCDVLTVKRQTVESKLVVCRGKEDVVSRIQVGGHREPELLGEIGRLEVQLFAPFLCGLALETLIQFSFLFS